VFATLVLLRFLLNVRTTILNCHSLLSLPRAFTFYKHALSIGLSVKPKTVERTKSSGVTREERGGCMFARKNSLHSSTWRACMNAETIFYFISKHMFVSTT
jgi:hypothetical protein